MAVAAQPREGKFVVDGCSLRYVEWPRAGRTLLIIPGSGGLGGSPWSWRGLAEAMNDVRRVVVLVMRGHAGSCWSEPYDFSRFIADISAYVRSVGEEVDVLGHSSGAWWAWGYAEDPDGRTGHLILVDPVLPWEGRDERPQTLRERSWRTQEELIDELRVRWRVVPSADADLVASVRDGTHRLPNGMWTWRLDPVLQEGIRPGTHRPGLELIERSREIRARTLLLLRDEHPQQERFRELFGRDAVVVVPKAHHVMQLSSPDELARLTREFLLA